MEHLLALVALSFVSTVTPGPNNVLLWASGASFGVRRTLPHVFGTALGVGAMALAAAVASGVVIAAIPGIETAMKLAGSAYLIYLAVQIARSASPEHAVIARPLGLLAAAGFQLLNPKVWIFALSAMTTFRLVGLPDGIGVALMVATMTSMVVPTALLWAGAGGTIGRFITTPRARRVVNLALAALLLGTVALVWI